jgi:hypothetical protein
MEVALSSQTFYFLLSLEGIVDFKSQTTLALTPDKTGMLARE